MKPNLPQKLKYYNYSLKYKKSKDQYVSFVLNQKEVFFGFQDNNFSLSFDENLSNIMKFIFDGETFIVEPIIKPSVLYLNSDLLLGKKRLISNDTLRFLDKEIVYNSQLRIDSVNELKRLLKAFKDGALPLGIDPADILHKLANNQDIRETFAIAASIDIPELDPSFFDKSPELYCSTTNKDENISDFFSTIPTIKILFLAANPSNTAKLQLAEEFKEISQAIKEGKSKFRFDLEHEWSVTPDKLQKYVGSIKPHILHFTGHGEKGNPELTKLAESLGRDMYDGGGIILHNPEGTPQLVPTLALSKLFKLFSSSIDLKIVLLSSCYSEAQAEVISRHIPYVIGMSDQISCSDATRFSCGFYSSLAQENTPERSFELAKNLVELYGSRKSHIPVLYRNGKKII